LPNTNRQTFSDIGYELRDNANISGGGSTNVFKTEIQRKVRAFFIEGQTAGYNFFHFKPWPISSYKRSHSVVMLLSGGDPCISQLGIGSPGKPQRKSCGGDGGRYADYLQKGVFAILTTVLFVLGIELICNGVKTSYDSVSGGLGRVACAALATILAQFVLLFFVFKFPLP
jgi:hypothetical protein